MNDLMIDIETLGKGTDAVVVSIGAVFFDIANGHLGPEFVGKFNIDQQLERGRKVDGSTLQFWLTQDEEAKSLFSEIHAVDTADTLIALNDFIQGTRDKLHYVAPGSKLRVWGNGATFDIVIMESLYKSYGAEAPWSFRDIMDLRTFRRFLGHNDNIINNGIKHNALDDAKAQAQFILDHTLHMQIND